MIKIFHIYHYLSPVLLLPLSYYLWLERLNHQHKVVLFVLSMPVLFAYIIPAIGTNWFKLWEFHAPIKLGRFLPHHGFIFGGSISLVAFWCAEPSPLHLGLFELTRAGFIMGTVMAFWNWLFDIYLIKSGFMTVYNKPYAQNLGPEAIAADYAPLYFGAFGVCYGLAIFIGRYYLLELGRLDLFGLFLAAGNLVVLVVPVLAFMLSSYLKDKSTGLKAYSKLSEPTRQTYTQRMS